MERTLLTSRHNTITIVMSDVAAEQITALGGTEKSIEIYPNHEVALGRLSVWRALPIRERRMVGPWCFLDRFGPCAFTDEKPMEIAPHPHIGLQTVTWLLEGEALHNDSLGYDVLLRAGGVNVMTAGSGIAHAERTPSRNSGRLNGAQLWVALPDADRNVAADLQHLPDVPRLDVPGGIAQVFAGSIAEAVSPARHFSGIVGADITLHAGPNLLELPLDAGHEHALLLMTGDCTLEGQRLGSNMLYYLAPGRSALSLGSAGGGRVLLVGGRSFPEKILMWWNFVARTTAEIQAARADWAEHRRFAKIPGYRGERMEAPEMMRLAGP